MSKTYRFILTGVGNVGQDFLQTMIKNGDLVRQRYGFSLQLVGAADSRGIVYDNAGLDMAALLAHKQAGHPVSSFNQQGESGTPPAALFERVTADLLLEATPTDLTHGQPGLDLTRTALQKGMHAILASKGPLVLAFNELAQLSDLETKGAPALRFSGATAGVLPTTSFGMRELAGSQIHQIDAAVNGTTQLILDLMGEGQSYETALKAAQEAGIAEPDSTLDVDGWDSANKLVIIANTVLRQPTTLADISVTGIRSITETEIKTAIESGGRISLIARAIRPQDSPPNTPYTLSVAPITLPPTHDLAHLRGDGMGIVYHTDVFGRLAVLANDIGVGTGAAMLKDIIELLG
ncbi:MAG: homoserine dehydrogenase [Chloroflexota bacterium]